MSKPTHRVAAAKRRGMSVAGAISALEQALNWEVQLDKEVKKWLRNNSSEWWDYILTEEAETIRRAEAEARAKHKTSVGMITGGFGWVYEARCSSCSQLKMAGMAPGAEAYARAVARDHTEQFVQLAIKEFIESI